MARASNAPSHLEGRKPAWACRFADTPPLSPIGSADLYVDTAESWVVVSPITAVEESFPAIGAEAKSAIDKDWGKSSSWRWSASVGGGGAEDTVFHVRVSAEPTWSTWRGESQKGSSWSTWTKDQKWLQSHQAWNSADKVAWTTSTWKAAEDKPEDERVRTDLSQGGDSGQPTDLSQGDDSGQDDYDDGGCSDVSDWYLVQLAEFERPTSGK